MIQADSIILFNLSTESFPKIDISIEINKTYQVQIYKNRKLVDCKYLKCVNSGRCYKYSILKSLISEMKDYKISNENEVNDFLNVMEYNFDKIMKSKLVCEEKSKKLTFIKEQVNLTFMKSPRYSIETLIFSTLFHITFPAGYKHLRNSGLMILPHPNYLSTFSAGNLESGVAESYLKKQFELLDPHEKFIVMMVDEIYV